MTETRPETYTGPDGLQYCSVCHTPRQVLVLGMKMSAACRCRQQQLQKEKEQQQAQQLARRCHRNRQLCFEDAALQACTFENDDAADEALSRQLWAYAEQFDTFRAQGSGLVLYGPVGTGKSFYAAAVANRLLDKGHTVFMVNMARLVVRLQAAGFEERQTILKRLIGCDLLIIDDLGTEQQSKYMLDQLFMLVDARSQAQRPLLVTTNLTWQALTQPATQEQDRIFDRLLQRCTPLALRGVSRRRQQAQENWRKMREKLTACQPQPTSS